LEELWVRAEVLTFSDESAKVLHGVVGDISALILIESNIVSITGEVGWPWKVLVLHGLNLMWECRAEDLIHLHSVLDLLKEGIMVGWGWVLDNLVVEVVK